MTIGVIAGFSLLALASGFFLVKKGWTASSGGSSTSEILGKDDLNSILGIDEEYIYTPIGKLENSSVTDYPFDSDNPDFTGAKYILIIHLILIILILQGLNISVMAGILWLMSFIFISPRKRGQALRLRKKKTLPLWSVVALVLLLELL